MREPPRYDFRLEDLRAWHLVEASCRRCRHKATMGSPDDLFKIAR